MLVLLDFRELLKEHNIFLDLFKIGKNLISTPHSYQYFNFPIFHLYYFPIVGCRLGKFVKIWNGSEIFPKIFFSKSENGQSWQNVVLWKKFLMF